MTSSHPNKIHPQPVQINQYDLDDDAINYHGVKKADIHEAVSWALHDWMTDCWSTGQRQSVEGSVARFLDNLAKKHKLTGWAKP